MLFGINKNIKERRKKIWKMLIKKKARKNNLKIIGL